MEHHHTQEKTSECRTHQDFQQVMHQSNQVVMSQSLVGSLGSKTYYYCQLCTYNTYMAILDIHTFVMCVLRHLPILTLLLLPFPVLPLIPPIVHQDLPPAIIIFQKWWFLTDAFLSIQGSTITEVLLITHTKA